MNREDVGSTPIVRPNLSFDFLHMICYSQRMLEIERKFLVTQESFNGLLERNLRHNYNIQQGYILNTDEVCIRVRIEDHMVPGPDRIRAVLAVKKPVDDSYVVREEDQYDIHLEMAHHIMEGMSLIVKSRFEMDGYDIDVFQMALTGLIVAEKEYPSLEEANADSMPSWAYAEVTDDPAYTNNNLVGKEFVNGELQ